MKPTDRVAVPPHVMARKVGEENVMLDLESGTYFGLDEIGTRAWQLLAEGRSIEESCAVLLQEYDVEPPELERDVMALVTELVSQRLLVLA